MSVILSNGLGWPGISWHNKEHLSLGKYIYIVTDLLRKTNGFLVPVTGSDDRTSGPRSYLYYQRLNRDRNCRSEGQKKTSIIQAVDLGGHGDVAVMS